MFSNTKSEEGIEGDNNDGTILSGSEEGAVRDVDLNFEHCPIGSFQFYPYSSNSPDAHICQPCWELNDSSLMNPMCQTFWLLIFLIFSITLLFLQIFIKIKFKLRRLEEGNISNKIHDNHIIQEEGDENDDVMGLNEDEEEFYEILRSVSLERSFWRFKAHSCHFIGYWMNCLSRWGYEEVISRLVSVGDDDGDGVIGLSRMEADVFVCYLEEISSTFIPSKSNTPFKKPTSKSFLLHADCGDGELMNEESSSLIGDGSSSNSHSRYSEMRVGYDEMKEDHKKKKDDIKTPVRSTTPPSQTKKQQQKKSLTTPVPDQKQQQEEKKVMKSHHNESQDKEFKNESKVKTSSKKKTKGEEKEIMNTSQEKSQTNIQSQQPTQTPTTNQTKKEISPRSSFERSKVKLAELLEFLDENSSQFSDVENGKMDEIASNILELQHEEDEILKHEEESSIDGKSQESTNNKTKKTFHQAEEELNQLFSQLESFKHKIISPPNDDQNEQNMKERTSDGSEEDGFFGSFFS